MSLLATVLILIVWAICAIIRKLTPPDPPIDDMDKYLKELMQCRNQKERRKFIKQDAARRRNKNNI